MFTITTESEMWFLVHLLRSIRNAITSEDVHFQRGCAFGHALAQLDHYEYDEIKRYIVLANTIGKQRAQQLLDAEFNK